jgi:hypothetical protein
MVLLPNINNFFAGLYYSMKHMVDNGHPVAKKFSIRKKLKAKTPKKKKVKK